MKDDRWHVGVSQKQNPFLQIPLSWMYHIGDHGIDSGMGVETWEERYGTQMSKLDWVNNQLPYDIWEQARIWEGKNRLRNIATKRFISKD